MEKLSVCLNRVPLGMISLDGPEDRYGLEYLPSWLDEPGYAVSPHLLPGKCSSGAVKRFLSNLLPEGKWLEELSLDSGDTILNY